METTDTSSSTESAAGGDGVLHLYAPFEGLKGIEPVPLVAAIPFYSDPEMTDALGTLTILGVTIPSEATPVRTFTATSPSGGMTRTRISPPQTPFSR